MSRRAVVAYLAVLLIACSTGFIYEKQETAPNKTSEQIQLEIIKKNGGCANNPANRQ